MEIGNISGEEVDLVVEEEVRMTRRLRILLGYEMGGVIMAVKEARRRSDLVCLGLGRQMGMPRVTDNVLRPETSCCLCSRATQYSARFFYQTSYVLWKQYGNQLFYYFRSCTLDLTHLLGSE